MVITKTTHGLVAGEERDKVVVFRGIPYGDDCDGNRRFQPAGPTKDWDGIRDCTKNGYCAVQFNGSIIGSEIFGYHFSGGHPELFFTGKEEQDENCLNLNVLTPGIDQNKRPVIVYIHGGGFSGGSGILVLGADRWVREEDIVLVGVNHRLNIFGYLYLGGFDPRYEKSGMTGIEDLILALEWVRDNIHFFGGNPENVTLMGESGGAMKINILLMIKKVRSLFHKVIIESGALLTEYITPEEGSKVTRRIMRYLNISDDEWEKLLAVPADLLLKASNAGGNKALSFYPIGDNRDLLYNLTSVFDCAEDSENIPMLIGSSQEELGAFIDGKQARVQVTGEQSGAEALAARMMEPASDMLLTTPFISADNVNEIISEFINKYNKADPLDKLFLRAKSMCGGFGLNPYCQAEGRVRKKSSRTFLYLVTYETRNSLYKEMKMAWHTAELPLQMRIVAYPEDEAISKIYGRSFAAFARRGNPSIDEPGKELNWPAYTLTGKETMIFDEICESKRYPYEKIMDIMLSEEAHSE